MKLVIGMPVMNRGWILPQWFEAVEQQGVEHTVLALLSPSDDDTEQILKDHGAEILEHQEPSPRTAFEIDNHVWGNMPKYQYMADLRNGLCFAASLMGADYFFSLDSDIILPPDGLKKLLTYAERHPGVVAPAVNMSIGSVSWNVMDWVDPTNPNMAERKDREIKPRQRDVIMAAMLLDRNAMKVCQWEAHTGGEDVGFSVHAWRNEIPLWWNPEVRCQHIMRRF